MTLWTAADAARDAAAELAGGGGLQHAFRCLLQLLDDYQRALTTDGVPAGAELFATAPSETGDVRVDAALAGLAEHLARRDGWRPPTWAFDQNRYAKPWWFVSGLKSWHATAIVESPLAFRKRGVFITESALTRV
ncbi:hypothetical protein [Solwaraspora sp. WMMA2065]|uniref:hypothetical protein n=1 Tax=Solwaraspora sp. WMMA2065 TaxID=3015166 RepID=UPI00259B7628|nr:hypothetical protein [Solwaraspora sp. WMMA2065]WJK37250.1 hypothetical protein O7610_13390 [Solwaraspora sp. WMMA2065]